MIKLVVDARPLTRSDGGIKRYTASILNELVQDSDFNIVLYADQNIPINKFNFLTRVNCRIYTGPAILKSILWFSYIHRWLKIDNPDIFWSPRHHLPIVLSKSTKAVVTIHDVIWKSHPQTMKKTGYFNEMLHMPRSIQQADLIFSPTQYTSAEIIKYWPSASSKIATIKHGIDFDVGSSIYSQSNDEKYILAVGTLEPRKNYPRLIQAFDNWAETNKDHTLIIIGREGWKTHEINKALSNCLNSSRVQILSNVKDDELKVRYQNATAFVQISIAEGFGLPIIEAQMYGLPLILSDIPVFHEVVNDSDAVWVNPLDLESIENGLTKSINSPIFVTNQYSKPWQQTTAEIRTKLKELV